MQVHTVIVAATFDEPHYRFLCSDLHIGSAYADTRRIVADLSVAKAADARVLINGDVFDAIGPGDKRFAASALSKAARGQDDVTRAVVQEAADLLRPFASIIDVIGIGNHEEAYIRRCNTDLVGLLLDTLNRGLEKDGDPHRIAHGGIQGYIRTRFRLDGASSRITHHLLYQHGSGGDSPVTKGAIDAYRRLVNFDYDCLTFGHKHNQTFGKDAFLYVNRFGRVRQRERCYVQSASYLWNYRRTTQSDPLAYSYAESKHHAPKPLGGLFLVLTPRRSWERAGSKQRTIYRIDQDVMTPGAVSTILRGHDSQ